MTGAAARRRLVEAARKLLWERGLAATSPRAVLAESGVGQGSLYHHFPTKKALAEAALSETADRLTAEAEAVLADAATPPLDRLRRWLGRPRPGLKGCPMGRMAADPDVFDAALQGPLTRYFDRLQALLAAALEDARAAGSLPADLETRSVAASLAAVIQGGYVLSRATGDGAAVNRATAGALALLDHLSATAGDPPSR
jgi:AcrR family transcriptional regulator